MHYYLIRNSFECRNTGRLSAPHTMQRNRPDSDRNTDDAHSPVHMVQYQFANAKISTGEPFSRWSPSAKLRPCLALTLVLALTRAPRGRSTFCNQLYWEELSPAPLRKLPHEADTLLERCSARRTFDCVLGLHWVRSRWPVGLRCVFFPSAKLPASKIPSRKIFL